MIVRRIVRLHPRTVSNYQAHLRPRSAPVKAAQVTHIKVDPRVWSAAIALAQGNMRRIQVLDSENVVVHNGDWRKR